MPQQVHPCVAVRVVPVVPAQLRGGAVEGGGGRWDPPLAPPLTRSTRTSPLKEPSRQARLAMARPVSSFFFALILTATVGLPCVCVEAMDLSGVGEADLKAILSAAGETCEGCSKAKMAKMAEKLLASGSLKTSRPAQEESCAADDESCQAEAATTGGPGTAPRPGFADYTFASYVLALNAQSLLETGEWRRANGVSDATDPKTGKPMRPPRDVIDAYYRDVGQLYAAELEKLGRPPPHNASDIPKEESGECSDPVTFSAYFCAQHEVAARYFKTRATRKKVMARIGPRLYEALGQYLDEGERDGGDDIKALSKHTKKITAQLVKLGMYGTALIQWEPKARKVFDETGSATFLMTTRRPLYAACNDHIRKNKELKGFEANIVGAVIEQAFTAALIDVERRPPAAESIDANVPADAALEEWTVSNM